MSTSPAKYNSLKVLWHMTMHRISGGTHEERLDSFYKGQADDYDGFRKKLLHGREEMFGALPVTPGGTWVDLGSGTGENAEHLSTRLGEFGRVYQVDLCGSLLEVAQQRVAKRGWTNVEPVHADATQFLPPGGPGTVDLVTFSYSLTMIPDWFAAVDHAYNLLKPGGMIGVVDFFVSRKWVGEQQRRHRWSTRTLWPTWFAIDNVFLSPDHVPYLKRRFETQQYFESSGSVPFIPLAKVPYYWFHGRKPLHPAGSPLASLAGNHTGQQAATAEHTDVAGSVPLRQ